MKSGNRIIDMSGQRFGGVIAIAIVGRCADGKAKWPIERALTEGAKS